MGSLCFMWQIYILSTETPKQRAQFIPLKPWSWIWNPTESKSTIYYSSISYFLIKPQSTNPESFQMYQAETWVHANTLLPWCSPSQMLEYRFLLYSNMDDDGIHNYILDLPGKTTTGNARCSQKVLLLYDWTISNPWVGLDMALRVGGKRVHVSKSNDYFGV
jgi:hypothetical protein